MIWKYFLPFCGLSLLSLNSILLSSTVFNFDEVQFICFFFSLFVILVSCLRNICLTKGHEDLLLFYSKSIMVLSLTFRFVIYLGLIFVYSIR